MSEHDSVPRKTGLVVTGIFLVLIACFFLLITVFMGIMSLTAGSSTVPGSDINYAAVIAFYSAIAAVFMTFGIGTIRAKRWARKLMLTLSWIALSTGIPAFIFVLFYTQKLKTMLDRMGQANAVSSLIPVVIVLVIGFIAYILLPGVMVFFYGNRKVVTAVEYHDPGRSWTDACPTPVLAVSLMNGWTAPIIAMAMYFYDFPVPLFGTILKGWAGGLLYLIVLPLLVWTAWGLYRLEWRSWWINFVLMFLWCFSGTWTFVRLGLKGFYEGIGMPPDQLAKMDMTGIFELQGLINVGMIIMLVGYLGFLWYIRRYFGNPTGRI